MELMEENINYNNYDVQQPTDTNQMVQNTTEDCQKYCRKSHPNAPFFSWVSPQHADTSLRSRCYCKTSDQGRDAVTGITSGRVYCGPDGKKYCLWGKDQDL